MRSPRLLLTVVIVIAACQESARPAAMPAPRVLRIDVPSPRYLLVVLHGVGSSADDLLPLGRALSTAIPGLAVAAPDGFAAYDQAPTGRQWFSVKGVTEANRTERIRAAIAPIDAWIDSELARHQLGAERLVLLGFSQGAIISNWLALARVPAPRAVVSLSGRLAVPDDLATTATPAVLVVHGSDDPVIPVEHGVHAAAELERRGAIVTHHVFPGLGHSVDQRVFDVALAFLRDRLAD